MSQPFLKLTISAGSSSALDVLAGISLTTVPGIEEDARGRETGNAGRWMGPLKLSLGTWTTMTFDEVIHTSGKMTKGKTMERMTWDLEKREWVLLMNDRTRKVHAEIYREVRT